jgi:hypothetical protein
LIFSEFSSVLLDFLSKVKAFRGEVLFKSSQGGHGVLLRFVPNQPFHHRELVEVASEGHLKHTGLSFCRRRGQVPLLFDAISVSVGNIPRLVDNPKNYFGRPVLHQFEGSLSGGN